MFVHDFHCTRRLLEIQNYLKFKKMEQEKMVVRDSQTSGRSRIAVTVAERGFSASKLPDFSDVSINLTPTLH